MGLLPLASLVAAPLAAGSAGAESRGRSGPPVTLIWSTLSPPVNPPALAFACAVYDSDSKTVVLFGGVKPDGALSSDTWVWNGSTWTDYPGSEVQAPPAREMAAMAFDAKLHQLILFGGKGAGGQLLGDTWAWNGASWYDESGRTTGPGPSARAGAAMAYDAAGDLVLFGGTGGAGGADPSGTTASPDPTANPDPTASPDPTAGPDPTASPDPTGSVGVPALPPTSSDTSSVSPTTALGAATTVAPTVATDATSPHHGRKTRRARPHLSRSFPVVGVASSVTALALDVGVQARSPATRLAAVASASTTMLGDTWLWTADGWTVAPGPGPTPRTGAALGFDPAANVTVLFGGESAAAHRGSFKALADTWIWNGQAWDRPVLAATPPARDGAAMAPDTSTGGLVLFAGSGNSGDLGDTWFWNGRSWAPADTTGSLSPRVGAATAFDGATGKVLVFGGAGPGGVTRDDTVILSETAPVALSGGGVSAPPSSSTSSTSTAPAGATTQPAGNAAKTGLAPPSTSSLPGLHPARPPLSPLHPLQRGDLVTLSGAGFAPRAAVTISFHSEPVEVGKAVATASGHFTATVAVPNSASDGVHRFEASGQGRTGPVSELIATVKIVGVPGSDLTSSVEQRLVLTAVALLIPGVTWMALVVMGRMRRRRAVLG